MSGLRLARSSLAIVVPVFLLLLLLGYEARTEYREVTRSVRLVGNAASTGTDGGSTREPSRVTEPDSIHAKALATINTLATKTAAQAARFIRGAD